MTLVDRILNFSSGLGYSFLLWLLMSKTVMSKGTCLCPVELWPQECYFTCTVTLNTPFISCIRGPCSVEFL